MPLSLLLVAIGLILWFTIAPTIGMILTILGLVVLVAEVAGPRRPW